MPYVNSGGTKRRKPAASAPRPKAPRADFTNKPADPRGPFVAPPEDFFPWWNQWRLHNRDGAPLPLADVANDPVMSLLALVRRASTKYNDPVEAFVSEFKKQTAPKVRTRGYY